MDMQTYTVTIVPKPLLVGIEELQTTYREREYQIDATSYEWAFAMAVDLYRAEGDFRSCLVDVRIDGQTARWIRGWGVEPQEVTR